MEGAGDADADSSDSEAHLPPQQRKKRQRFKRHRGRRQRRRLRELQAQLGGAHEAEEESVLRRLGLDCFAATAADPSVYSEGAAAALPTALPNEDCFAATAADPSVYSEGVAAALPNEAAPRLAAWPYFDPEDGEPVCRTPSPQDSPRQQLLPFLWPGQPAPLQPLINVVYVEVLSGDGNFRCFMPQQVVSCLHWSGDSFADHSEQHAVPSNPEPMVPEPPTGAFESELRPEVMHSASSGLIVSSSDTSINLVHGTGAEVVGIEQQDAKITSIEESLSPTDLEQVGIGFGNQGADSFASPRSCIDELGSEEETPAEGVSKLQDKIPGLPDSPQDAAAKAKHLQTQLVNDNEEDKCEMYTPTTSCVVAKQAACEGGDPCTTRRQSALTPQSRREPSRTPWTKLVLVAAAVAVMVIVVVGGNLLAGYFSLAPSSSKSAEVGCAEGSSRRLAEASVEAFEPDGRSISSTLRSMKLSAPIVVIPMEAGRAVEPSKAEEFSMDQTSWNRGRSVISIDEFAELPVAARPSQMKLSEPVVLLPEARNRSSFRVEDN